MLLYSFMRATAANTFEIIEHGDVQKVARLSAGVLGVRFTFDSYEMRMGKEDHVIFSISPDDAAEIAMVSADLIQVAQQAAEVGRLEIPWQVEELGGGSHSFLDRLATPSTPVVRRLDEGIFPNKWELRGGKTEDEDVVLGGLGWLRDRLDIRANQIAEITFEPVTFRQFAAIASARPDIPDSNVWGTAGQ